jgi:hypothetical protein
LFILISVRVQRNKHAKRDEASNYANVNSEEPLIAQPYYSREKALISSDSVHWIFRYLLVIAICGTIALFISSNLGKGASVKLDITSGNSTVTIPLFVFSLKNSVEDFYNAKVYALSFLVATLSGAWPYLKLVLMFLCWVLPPMTLSTKRRESILITIDALGKWSLFDSFIMVLFQVAFHFNIEIGGNTTANEPPVVASMIVDAEPGFMTFVIATILSLWIGHFCLHWHRLDFTHQGERTNSGRVEPVSDHMFRAGDEAVEITGFGKATVTLFLMGTIAVFIHGIMVTSFSFVFEGLLGALMGDANKRSYSIWSLGEVIASTSTTPTGFTTLLTQVVFFVFGVFVPLIHCVAILFFWLVPLSDSALRKIYVFCEVLHAWSGLDVLVVVIIAAMFEIRQFCNFIIGSKCDGINKILKAYFDKQLHGDDKCFDTIATTDDGTWQLLAAVVVYTFVANAAMQACRTVIRERDARQGERSRGITCWTRLTSCLGLTRVRSYA